jgi:hypothetical protein
MDIRKYVELFASTTVHMGIALAAYKRYLRKCKLHTAQRKRILQVSVEHVEPDSKITLGRTGKTKNYINVPLRKYTIPILL